MPIDAQQLAELIEKHAGSLRLWVRSRCAEGEDVVQNAFCKLALMEPVPHNPVAWLYQVSRNLAEKQRLSDSRRRKREQQWSESKSSIGNAVNHDSLPEVLVAVEQLESELREVLVARVWGQLSFDEVARMCGISTATAFRRYEAALQLLRGKLKLHGEESS